jgi:hypothetical protein
MELTIPIEIKNFLLEAEGDRIWKWYNKQFDKGIDYDTPSDVITAYHKELKRKLSKEV